MTAAQLRVRAVLARRELLDNTDPARSRALDLTARAAWSACRDAEEAGSREERQRLARPRCRRCYEPGERGQALCAACTAEQDTSGNQLLDRYPIPPAPEARP